MKTRLPFLLLTLALVGLLAACGGGGSTQVPADAIAQVGSTPISKATFNSLMAVACARYKAQGQACPKVGTPTYSSLRSSAVTFLVQQEELKQDAQKKLGVTVTQQDLDKQVEQIKKTYYHGDDKKFEAALKQQGFANVAEFEQIELRPNLLGQKVKAKLTSTVSNAAALKYYNQNKSSFVTPKTREVRHILVKDKSLAEKIEQQVKNGANFGKLAQKYSTDKGSAAQGGKLCVAHGTASAGCNPTVAPFDKAAFSLKTNEVSLVHSVYGWHVIQPISAIRPAHTQTYKEVAAQIKANLASQNQQTALNTFVSNLTKDYKVSYQTGYEPATTTSAATTTG
ncbi:MAG TPA: peptidylprolyl isomerase [Gaiellaceae bacterium]|nr:peptidylprolyl isomerase [Gaiellaceae bacterium]